MKKMFFALLALVVVSCAEIPREGEVKEYDPSIMEMDSVDNTMSLEFLEGTWYEADVDTAEYGVRIYTFCDNLLKIYCQGGNDTIFCGINTKEDSIKVSVESIFTQYPDRYIPFGYDKGKEPPAVGDIVVTRRVDDNLLVTTGIEYGHEKRKILRRFKEGDSIPFERAIKKERAYVSSPEELNTFLR